MIRLSSPSLVAVAIAFAMLGASAPPVANAPIYSDHLDLLKVLNDDGSARPVQTQNDWKARKAHILAHAQETMGLLPGPERRVPLDVKIVEEFREPKYSRKKITYLAEPNSRIPAWLFVPLGLEGRKAPAMLALHQTTAIGKDEPAGLGGKPNLHYGKELAERGYVVLIPDYPGFGELKIDSYAMGYASATMKGIWNHIRGVDLLSELPEVDAGRIGVIGHSLGGHNSIFAAVFDERLKAVVSSCGFTRFPRYYGGDLTGWSHKGYMPRIRERYGANPENVPFDFPELLGMLAPRGFFTNSPLHDDNFDVQGVRDSLDAARKVYALWNAGAEIQATFPDSGHDFPPEQREAAYRFLDQRLKANANAGGGDR